MMYCSFAVLVVTAKQGRWVCKDWGPGRQGHQLEWLSSSRCSRHVPVNWYVSLSSSCHESYVGLWCRVHPHSYSWKKLQTTYNKGYNM